MTTLEKIKAEIEQFVGVSIHDVEVIGKNDILQIIDKYAEQEPKVTTTSTDEPMVIQYPQVDGITPTVVNAEQEPSRDIKEIAEIMKCDADAETKCKMISNILTAKPHYFAEQEPCDDVVSRQAVLDLCDSKDPDYLAIHFKEDVECLPSVRPKEQTGYWIEHHNQTRLYFKCSNCKTLHDEKSNYCPFCGIRMNGNYKGLTKIVIGENDVI